MVVSPEEKIKSLERRVMGLIEDSCMAASRGEIRLALDRAKEASSKERSLIRQREQAGLSDGHNLDLTFSVCLLYRVVWSSVNFSQQNRTLNKILKYCSLS